MERDHFEVLSEHGEYAKEINDSTTDSASKVESTREVAVEFPPAGYATLHPRRVTSSANGITPPLFPYQGMPSLPRRLPARSPGSTPQPLGSLEASRERRQRRLPPRVL